MRTRILPPDEATHLTAFIAGLLAAACFTTTILSSARAARLTGALPTLAGVMLVGLVLALPIAVVTIGEARPEGEALVYLAIAGVGNVVGLGSQYVAVRSGKIGVVGALAASEGAIAAILATIAGETLLTLEAFGVAVVGVGVILAALGRDPDAGEGRWSARAVVFGAIAGLAFGASLYSTGRIGADVAVGWAILPPRLVGVAFIALPLLASRRLHIARQARPFIAIAGAGEVGGFLAVAWGASDSIAITSALAAQFATLAALVAWLVLGERLGRVQWVGIAAVAVGVVTLAIGAGLTAGAAT